MAPTVILIRHAQALHNPALTELGFGQQCDDLANCLQHDFPLAQEIDLIVVSPLRRTLQTAQQSLGWLMKKGVRTIVRSEWQETTDKPCDTGTPISIMAKEWPQFDWSEVDPEYPSKTGIFEFSRPAITQRGIKAKEWLRNRPEKVIAVVSHCGFLRAGVSYKNYENADFRVFDFAEGHEEIGGNLVEWKLTEQRGGGMGKSPEQNALVIWPKHYPLKSMTNGSF